VGERYGCCFCARDIPDPRIPEILEIKVSWNDTPETKWDVPDFLQDKIGGLTWWAHFTCFAKPAAKEPKECCFCEQGIPDAGTPDIVDICVTWKATPGSVWDTDFLLQEETSSSLTWWAHDKCFREELNPEYRPFNRTY